MNDPLYLEDSFGNLARVLMVFNLARVLMVFNEEKTQKQMGGHFLSKYKEDEFEGVGVTNFGFIEEIPDVPWP